MTSVRLLMYKISYLLIWGYFLLYVVREFKKIVFVNILLSRWNYLSNIQIQIKNILLKIC